MELKFYLLSSTDLAGFIIEMISMCEYIYMGRCHGNEDHGNENFALKFSVAR